MKDIYRSQVRFPRQLSEWLKEKAEKENRSMNAQLIYELERARWREQEVA